MSITKDTIKETIKTIMAEEGDYKAFFKKALEKAGKDIPSMSDEEKKEFFNKIDAAWDGKGEKNEGNAFGAAVTKAKEKGEDEFEVDGKTYKVESVNEGNLKLSSSAKKYWNTPSKKLFGGGYNLYDNIPPSQWNTHPEIIDGYGKNAGADIFKGFIRDNIDGKGYLDSKIAKMIGLPTNVSIIDYLNDGGSGLNGNKNFKKFNNWFSALYDIYEEMEKKFGKVKAESVNEDQWRNTRIQSKNIFRMLKQKYNNNIPKMEKGLETVLKQNKTKNDQGEIIRQEFKKYFKIKESIIKEAKNDNLYVVIDFHEKGGGFVMTKPSSKKLADDSARSITKTRDITKREVLKVKDARKIRGLAGKEYLKEESVNEVNESHSDCGCGCGGVTEGGCSTNLPIELSDELTFEINTFLERPVLSKNNNKITVENSELSNLIPTLVKNEIHKRLSSGVKKEFIELLKNYK